VEDVFGAVVFGGGFPVAEGVEADAEESWIVEFFGDSASLFGVEASLASALAS